MSFMHWMVLFWWAVIVVVGTYATRSPGDLFGGWRQGLWAIPVGATVVFAILFAAAP